MANLKLHTIGIHGGFHHNFLYTVVRTVTTLLFFFSFCPPTLVVGRHACPKMSIVGHMGEANTGLGPAAQAPAT